MNKNYTKILKNDGQKGERGLIGERGDKGATGKTGADGDIGEIDINAINCKILKNIDYNLIEDKVTEVAQKKLITPDTIKDVFIVKVDEKGNKISIFDYDYFSRFLDYEKLKGEKGDTGANGTLLTIDEILTPDNLKNFFNAVYTGKDGKEYYVFNYNALSRNINYKTLSGKIDYKELAKNIDYTQIPTNSLEKSESGNGVPNFTDPNDFSIYNE